jgi:hypothetical protein
MPRKKKPPTHEPPSPTPAAEPSSLGPEPVLDANDSPRIFAEDVGRRSGPVAPDPFGIAGDYLAGVHLFESKRDRQMAIQFGEGRPEDKPSPEVIGKLKDAGFHWNPAQKVWAHPIWPASAMGTKIRAEELFQDICRTIRAEKGIDATPDIPL